MDATMTKNAISFSEAAREDWFLSSRPLTPRHTLSVKLNNGKTYKYLASSKVRSGDQVIIDFGGATSYQMGNVESVAKGKTVKGDHALKPLFTFSTDPDKEDIKMNAQEIKCLESVDEVRGYFDLNSSFGSEEKFRVVDYLIQGVLNAISVIAHPIAATAEQIAEAKAFLAEERPIPGIVFSKEFCDKYYNDDFFMLAECCETAFTGFYPGWKDDLQKSAFLNDPKLEELDIEADFNGGYDEHDYIVYLYYKSGSAERADYFSNNADFKAFTNELVYRSALSILIRGGFVNLLKAALSVEMPIRGFYEKLIAFAEKIGSTECAKLLKSVDYKNATFERVAVKKATNKDFVIRDGVLVEYKGNDETVTIPDSVKTIGDLAFKRNNSIKKVIIPDSVTQIKRYAFTDCEELREVVLGKNVSSMGVGCFNSCKSLASINLDNTKVKTLNNECFFRCSSLASIDLSKSKITAIKKGAFWQTGLEKIILPSKLETIGELAFDSTKLKEIVIPATVREISTEAFKWNTADRSEIKRIVFEGTERINFLLSSTGIDCVVACKRGSALMAMLEEGNAHIAERRAKYHNDSDIPRKLEAL